ncbi:unnamed protein product [Dicrocoelium dendriticum]|nr:unnamed protein product [Dicrocoelium dendriticum]
MMGQLFRKCALYLALWHCYPMAYFINLVVASINIYLHVCEAKEMADWNFSRECVTLDQLINNLVCSLVALSESSITHINIPAVGLNSMVVALSLLSWLFSWARRFCCIRSRHRLSDLGDFSTCMLQFFNLVLVCFNIATCVLLVILAIFWSWLHDWKGWNQSPYIIRSAYRLVKVLSTGSIHFIFTLCQLPALRSSGGQNRWSRCVKYTNISKRSVQLDTGTCQVYPLPLYCPGVFSHRRRIRTVHVSVMTDQKPD